MAPLSDRRKDEECYRPSISKLCGDNLIEDRNAHITRVVNSVCINRLLILHHRFCRAAIKIVGSD